MADKSADERIAEAFASHHTCFSSCVACNAQIAALRSELEQTKKERDSVQAFRDSERRLKTGIIESLRADVLAANARAERVIELRKYVDHTGECARYWTSERPCICGLSDLLRDLDAKEGK